MFLLPSPPAFGAVSKWTKHLSCFTGWWKTTGADKLQQDCQYWALSEVAALGESEIKAFKNNKVTDLQASTTTMYVLRGNSKEQISRSLEAS